MRAAAIKLAARVGYKGAGTVEFLYDRATERFYFIEANTRIQVEHPVTEMITGLDLVAEMICIAGGECLSIAQDDVVITGHAIECRINAEDPAKNFMPGPGTITRLVVPTATDLRFDSMLFEGYSVPPFYDSLLGKLIVHAADRISCLARLREVLGGLIIEGVPTTIALHAALAVGGAVARGEIDTRFLEVWLGRRFPAPSKS